jgi:hypothetical protein
MHIHIHSQIIDIYIYFIYFHLYINKNYCIYKNYMNIHYF